MPALAGEGKLFLIVRCDRNGEDISQIHNIIILTQCQGEMTHQVCSIGHCHKEQRSHCIQFRVIHSHSSHPVWLPHGPHQGNKKAVCRAYHLTPSNFKIVCPVSSLPPGSRYCFMHTTCIASVEQSVVHGVGVLGLWFLPWKLTSRILPTRCQFKCQLVCSSPRFIQQLRKHK